MLTRIVQGGGRHRSTKVNAFYSLYKFETRAPLLLFFFQERSTVPFARNVCFASTTRQKILSFSPPLSSSTNETHPIEGLNRLNEKNRRRIRGDCHAGNSRTAVENNFLFYFPLYEDGRGSNGKGVAVSRHQFFRKKCRDTWPPPPCERAGRGSSPRKRYVLWFYNANG